MFILLDDTNADWWQVETADGSRGYLPANYLKESKASKKSRAAVLGGEGGAAASPLVGGSPLVHKLEKRMKLIRSLHDDLEAKLRARRHGLDGMLSLHQLNSEANEVSSWLDDQLALAQVEGKDPPPTDSPTLPPFACLQTAMRRTVSRARDLEFEREWPMLICPPPPSSLLLDIDYMNVSDDKFAQFQKDIEANRMRVKVVNDLADSLMDDPSGDSAKIKARRDALNEQWEKLEALAQVRAKAMEVARRIQRFFVEVSDTHSWVKEKQHVSGGSAPRVPRQGEKPSTSLDEYDLCCL